MFTDEQISKVVDENLIVKPVVEKLLTLYVAEGNWWPEIARLSERLTRKHGPKKGKELLRKAVAFTILLPAYDKATKINKANPENLLSYGMSFHQFAQKDWFEELKKVIKRDNQITNWRKQIALSGVITHIDYQPYTRQAYKWLCEEAQNSGVELTKELQNKFRNFVMMYGGMVVSLLFERHPNASRKIVNFRSPYFVERAIFDVYSFEDVRKIKAKELQKTNPEWIKTIEI